MATLTPERTSESVYVRHSLVPVTGQAVFQMREMQYGMVREVPEDAYYDIRRGNAELLEPGNNYAELPGFGGQKALDLLSAVKDGGMVMDVGSGWGELALVLYDLLGSRNIQILATDVRNWPGAVWPPSVVSSVHELSRNSHGLLYGGADCIVSSAMLHHLADPWGAVRRLMSLVKPGGHLLLSGMPFRLKHGWLASSPGQRNASRDPNSEILPEEALAFDPDGYPIAPVELTRQLNLMSSGAYSMEASFSPYHLNNGMRASTARLAIRVDRPQEIPPLPLFYCRLDTDQRMHPPVLRYILARDPAEQAGLQDNGFTPVTA